MVEVDLFWCFNCEEIVVTIRSKGPFLKSQYIQVYDFLDPYSSGHLQQIPFLVPISFSTIELSHMRTWAQKYWYPGGYPIWDHKCTHVLKFVPILF